MGCQRFIHEGVGPPMNQKPEKNSDAKPLAKKIEDQIDVPECEARFKNSAANANKRLAIKGNRR